MTDFARIRANVELMAAKGAPEEHINDYLHSEGLTSYQFKARVEGMKTGDAIDNNVNTALKYSAGSGIANLLDLPGRTITSAGNLVRMGAGVVGNKLLGAEPLSTIPPNQLDVFNPALRKADLIDDAYAPTTPGGKVVDLATQAFTGGGINPASIARNAARGLARPIARDIGATAASGTGAGVGAALTSNVSTGNDSLDTAIKALATFGGGAAPGAFISARGTGGDRASAALSGVTPRQLELAKQLAQKASDLGSPITGYEAIQGITGLNPKMQTQQRVTEQSDAGAKYLTEMMQQRPLNNSGLFSKTTSGIAPKEPFPDVLAGELQNAAASAITKARQQGNQKAEPYYQASSNNPANKVPANTWNMLASDDGVMAALQAVKKDPYAGLQSAQEGSMSWLDQAKKHLDSQIEVSKREGNNFAAKQMAAARDKIVAAADAAFPDYAKARSIVSDNMQGVVGPMEASQVGKLARSDDFKQQSEAFLPNQPADVTPDVVTRTAQTIGAQNQNIIPRFLSQDLGRKFTEANQSLQGGEATMGGAKFAATVAGNDTQKANLIAALRSSGVDTAPFADALDVFRAQGYKPAVNSATTANMGESSKLSGPLNFATRPLKAVPEMIDNWRNGFATTDLAKALSSGPDSVQRIENLARANGVFDPMKQQMLINLLLANPQAQDQ